MQNYTQFREREREREREILTVSEFISAFVSESTTVARKSVCTERGVKAVVIMPMQDYMRRRHMVAYTLDKVTPVANAVFGVLDVIGFTLPSKYGVMRGDQDHGTQIGLGQGG